MRVHPSDGSFVINTHLHFDHVGGNTTRTDDGKIIPTFPNATYIVQQGEVDYATRGNERTTASYFAHNFTPLRESEQLKVVRGEMEVAKGITLVPTPGHTPYHQSVRIEN